MKLPGETKLFIGIIVATFAIIGAALAFLSQPASLVSRDKLLPPDTYVKGNKIAQIFLVEFSDFQCPACASFKPVVDEIINKYKDGLVFGYRHFPLTQHKFAWKAALTSEAAGEQEKYWEMYDYLFANSANLSDEVIKSGIQKLGLDEVRFQKAIDSNKLKDKISRDINDGKAFGVSATPTFFLNGKKLELFSQQDLKKEVEQEIAKLK